MLPSVAVLDCKPEQLFQRLPFKFRTWSQRLQQSLSPLLISSPNSRNNSKTWSGSYCWLRKKGLCPFGSKNRPANQRKNQQTKTTSFSTHSNRSFCASAPIRVPLLYVSARSSWNSTPSQTNQFFTSTRMTYCASEEGDAGRTRCFRT